MTPDFQAWQAGARARGYVPGSQGQYYSGGYPSVSGPKYYSGGYPQASGQQYYQGGYPSVSYPETFQHGITKIPTHQPSAPEITPAYITYSYEQEMHHPSIYNEPVHDLPTTDFSQDIDYTLAFSDQIFKAIAPNLEAAFYELSIKGLGPDLILSTYIEFLSELLKEYLVFIKKIENLKAKLDDDNWRVREKATEDLIKLSKDPVVFQILDENKKKTKSAEVKMRIGWLIGDDPTYNEPFNWIYYWDLLKTLKSEAKKSTGKKKKELEEKINKLRLSLVTNTASLLDSLVEDQLGGWPDDPQELRKLSEALNDWEEGISGLASHLSVVETPFFSDMARKMKSSDDRDDKVKRLGIKLPFRGFEVAEELSKGLD